MAEVDSIAESELLDTAAGVRFDIVKSEVIHSREESYVCIELRLGETNGEWCGNDVEWGAFSFIFALAAQSFADARPRGFSGGRFVHGDEFSIADNAQSG